VIPKIFVISLPEAVERREKMQAQLVTLGLDWEFIDAVNGSAMALLPSAYDQKKRLNRFGYDLSLGEIGCFESHKELWRVCVKSKRPLIILEDDVLLSDDFIGLVELIMSKNYDWDFFRLHGGTDHNMKTVFLFRLGKFRVVEELRDPSTAAAYIIKPSGAIKLLEHSHKYYHAVDDYIELRHINKLNILSIRPYPVTVGGFATTIKDRNNGKRSLSIRLRRMLFREISNLRKYIWQTRRKVELILKGLQSR